MDELIKKELMDLIEQAAAPLYTKIELLEDELLRMQEKIEALEKRVERMQLSEMSDQLDESANISDDENEPLEKDQTLLDHLLEEPKSVSDLVQHTPHLTLTIDLSKKN